MVLAGQGAAQAGFGGGQGQAGTSQLRELLLVTSHGQGQRQTGCSSTLVRLKISKRAISGRLGRMMGPVGRNVLGKWGHSLLGAVMG